MKYLYLFNYQSHEQGLCEMEYRIIFNHQMTCKHLITTKYFDHTRSVFIKGRMDILLQGNDIDEMVECLKGMELYYLRFKVIYLKNEYTHVKYKESLQWCKKMAWPIDGSVDVHDPQYVFALTKIGETYYFGLYHDKSEWYKRYDKPHSYSHSLNIRDARTIVNIAIGNVKGLKVVDPCCGIGTVVLEALSMGENIEGFDINRQVSYRARLNLEHFGYNPLVIKRANMLELKKHYDVVIMDIPYGVYSPFTYDQQCELIEGAYRLANRLVLVSHQKMDTELKECGYALLDQCSITKGSFTRYITLCQKI